MNQNFMTYYELLGVPLDASTDQINKAFKEKAKIHHPDFNGNSVTANEFFRLIKQAKEHLVDPTTRLQYDYSIGTKKNPTQTTIPLAIQQYPTKVNGGIVLVGILCLVIGVAIGSSAD